jgi:hypothetical protein
MSHSTPCGVVRVHPRMPARTIVSRLLKRRLAQTSSSSPAATRAWNTDRRCPAALSAANTHIDAATTASTALSALGTHPSNGVDVTRVRSTCCGKPHDMRARTLGKRADCPGNCSSLPHNFPTHVGSSAVDLCLGQAEMSCSDKPAALRALARSLWNSIRATCPSLMVVIVAPIISTSASISSRRA